MINYSNKLLKISSSSILKIIGNRFLALLFIQTIIKIFATFVGLYSTWWLINQSTVAEYADFSVIISFITLIQTIIIFGVPRFLQKTFTNSEDINLRGEVWSTLAMLRGISYLVGIIGIIGFLQFSSIEDFPLTLLLFTSQFVILADEAFRAICDANGQTWKYSLTDLLEKILTVTGLMAYPLLQGADSSMLTIFPGLYSNGEINPVWYFGLVTLVSRIVMVSCDYIWQKKYIVWKKPSLSIIKNNRKALVYLTITSVFMAIARSGQIVLDLFQVSDSELGLFYNANRIYTVGLIIPGMTIPMIASLVRKKLLVGKIHFLARLLKSNKFSTVSLILIEWLVYTLLAGVLLSVFLSLASPLAIILIDSDNKYPFTETLVSTIILFSSLIFYVPNVFISHIMSLSHYESYHFAATVASGIIGLASTFLMIYYFGTFGAAWAILITSMFDFIIRSILIRKILKNGDILNKNSS
jgi:O-antigen/teichoic acid export membrane protein